MGKAVSPAPPHFPRLAVTPIRPPRMSSATRSRSLTTASARQGVASSGMKPRQSRTPAPFDDDPRHDRPGVGADPVLGLAQLVAGEERRLGLRQAGAGAEAGRTEAVGRDRAQLIEPGALMGAAQRFADQPADVVELRIVRRQHPVGAHGVEWIDDPAGPVGVAGRRPGPNSLARASRSGVASSRSWTASSSSCGDLRVRLAGFRAPLN